MSTLRVTNIQDLNGNQVLSLSGGNATIAGDLTIQGTTTSIETTNLIIEDKNIILGQTDTAATDATADGGGITLKGATDKTINWVNSTDAWTFSEHINIANAKEYRINGTKVLDATSLGSAVVGSSLASVGTIATGVWNGTAIATAYIADSAVTSAKIADGTIVNADINASAEIAVSKLANGTARQLLQTDSGGTGVEFTSNVDIPGTLDVTGAATFDSTVTATGLITANGKVSFSAGTAAAPSLYSGSDTDTGIYSPDADQVAVATNGTERMRIDSSGSLNIKGAGTAGVTQAVHFNGSAPVNSLVVDSSGSVGIGTNTPNGNSLLTLGGLYPSFSSTTYACTAYGAMPSSSTGEASAFLSNYSTQDSAVTYYSLAHYIAAQGTITGGSRLGVTNQIGFQANASLTGATNNYGFLSRIASGTGRWNFYAEGTANNYFAGSVGIGAIDPGSKLAVNGAITESTDGGTTYHNVVTAQDIGTDPNQVPLNQFLGQLAFMDSVGDVPTASSAPQDNLSVNFEYVSNTSLKIRMRGTDGVVRSVTLTLS